MGEGQPAKAGEVMHVFWHNGGVSIRPDNEQEHNALVLLFENAKAGWPTNLSAASCSREPHESSHLDIRNEQLGA